ncbi:MAG TPA: hypothetical protein VEZ14_04940 [Dehalococcoidia bacterium]|nr:hypothetical protein [Dehalococcoidia bacterium]
MTGESGADLDKRGDEPTFVIGQELADAAAVEARHRLRDRTPSLLAGVAYDASRGEADLFRFIASPVDDVIERFVVRCAAIDAPERARVRSALTQDDFYTLLLFAQRGALRTLRTKSPASAQAAIDALSLVELKRMDPRDATAGVALASYAVSRMGGDASATLERGASMSELGLAGVFVRFIRQPVVSLSEWGFREVETHAGVTLVWDHGAPFAPAYDLVSIARAIGDLIEADVWTVSHLSVGADLPKVWLGGRDRRIAEFALASLRGCATIGAKLSPMASPDAHAQQFTAFVVETAAPKDAAVLSEAALAASGGGHVALAMARGPVCVIIVSRSFYAGVESFERGASLDRFRSGVQAILADHVT